MRKCPFCVLVLFGGLVFARGMAAQGRSANTESETVSCNFADGKQITFRYNRIPFDEKESCGRARCGCRVARQ